MADLDALPLTQLLRQVSLDASAGNISAETRAIIKEQILPLPPSAPSIVPGGPALDGLPPLGATRAPPLVRSNSLLEAAPVALVPLLKHVSECYNQGLISAEQKRQIKALLFQGKHTAGQQQLQRAASIGPAASVADRADEKLSLLGNGHSVDDLPPVGPPPRLARKPTTATWVASISLDVLRSLFSFMDAVSLTSFTAACKHWYHASTTGERSLNMWRSRLLSCLGNHAKITSFMEERYSVQDWRHAFLETLRLQEADLFERNALHHDMTHNDNISYYEREKLQRMLDKENERAINRSLLQPRKLATKELVAGESKSRSLVRMQIGRIRRSENPNLPPKKHLLAQREQFLELWDLHTAKLRTVVRPTKVHTPATYGYDNAGYWRLLQEVEKHATNGYEKIREWRACFRSQLIAIDDGLRSVWIYAMLPPKPEPKSEPIEPIAEPEPAPGEGNVFDSWRDGDEGDAAAGEAEDAENAGEGDAKDDDAKDDGANDDADAEAEQKADDNAASDDRKDEQSPPVPEHKSAEETVFHSEPLVEIKCALRPCFMQVVYLPASARTEAKDAPSALLVLGFSFGQVEVYNAHTGKLLHRLFPDARAESLGEKPMQALKLRRYPPVLCHVVAIPDDTVEVTPNVFLLHVVDGTAFHLVDLASGKVSKQFCPHPKRKGAQFAMIYQQPATDKRKSHPMIVSGHNDGSVIAYWLNSKWQYLHEPYEPTPKIANDYLFRHLFHLEPEIGVLFLKHLGYADNSFMWDLRSLSIIGLFELPTDTLAVPLFNAMLPDTGGLYASSSKFASDKYKVMRLDNDGLLHVWSWARLTEKLHVHTFPGCTMAYNDHSFGSRYYHLGTVVRFGFGQEKALLAYSNSRLVIYDLLVDPNRSWKVGDFVRVTNDEQFKLLVKHRYEGLPIFGRIDMVQADFLRIKFERECTEWRVSGRVQPYRSSMWIPHDWEHLEKIPPGTGLVPQQPGVAPGGPAAAAASGARDQKELKTLDLTPAYNFRMNLKTGDAVVVIYPRARDFRERVVGRKLPPYIELLLPKHEHAWYGDVPEWWLQSNPNIISPEDWKPLSAAWAAEAREEEQERQRSLQVQAEMVAVAQRVLQPAHTPAQAKKKAVASWGRRSKQGRDIRKAASNKRNFEIAQGIERPRYFGSFG